MYYSIKPEVATPGTSLPSSPDQRLGDAYDYAEDRLGAGQPLRLSVSADYHPL